MKHDFYTNRDSRPKDFKLSDAYGDEPDIFRFNAGYHNGPECKRCGKAECHHCYPDFEDEECSGG